MTQTKTLQGAIDNLAYAAYRHNRELSPNVKPERWSSVFDGYDVPALEARYQRQLASCPICGTITTDTDGSLIPGVCSPVCADDQRKSTAATSKQKCSWCGADSADRRVPEDVCNLRGSSCLCERCILEAEDVLRRRDPPCPLCLRTGDRMFLGYCWRCHKLATDVDE